MKLGKLMKVIERSQAVTVYKVGEDGFCYQGMAYNVPERLKTLKVESVNACEWELGILVS